MTKRGEIEMEIEKFLKELKIVDINDPTEDFRNK